MVTWEFSGSWGLTLVPHGSWVHGRSIQSAELSTFHYTVLGKGPMQWSSLLSCAPWIPLSSLKRSFTQKWRSLSTPLHYPQDFRKLSQCICQRLGTVLLMQKLHEWDSQGCDPPCQSMQQLKFTKGQMSLLIIMGFSHNAPALRAAGRFLERAHFATHFNIY